MPITQQDIQPFIPPSGSQAFIPNMPSYYGGNVPTGPTRPSSSGGGIPNINPFGGPSSGAGNVISNPLLSPGAFLDPFGSSLLGGLFASDPKWSPYTQNGQYYWADPSHRNPVPLASVPGAPLSPSSTYRKTAGNVQALVDMMPYLQNTIAQGIPTNALAQLQASQLTSGPYAQLMTQLYNQYGPQLNAIGNEISRRNALAQASTDKEVLEGPGGDLVKRAYELSQTYDKPYYDTRQTVANRLGSLLGSIDLSGGLSDTERSEISKGLARQNLQAGTAFSPSQTNTVANAMQYGQAGYQRKTQAQNQLAQAISAANAFLPASKSGVDVFQVATGRPSTPNSGNSLFTGVNRDTSQGGQVGAGLIGSMFGNMAGLQGQQMQIDANKKDWLDKMNQITSSVGNIASVAGGFGL